MSASPRPTDGEPSTSTPPVNKHLLTPVELQRQQLAKLLKDPAKPVSIPAPPKDKTLRAPREMMKNVQGSSAGAGSGEFHVYKQNRRREYERLKLMDEKSKQEMEALEFEQRKREREEAAEAKTARNRAKRQKKKKAKTGKKDEEGEAEDMRADNGPVKKRRILGGDGKEVTFRRPGEEDESDDDGPVLPAGEEAGVEPESEPSEPIAIAEQRAIIIHDDD